MIYIKQSISKELWVGILARHLPSFEQFVLQSELRVDAVPIFISLGIVADDVVRLLLLFEDVILILAWHWPDYASAIVRYLAQIIFTFAVVSRGLVLRVAPHFAIRSFAISVAVLCFFAHFLYSLLITLLVYPILALLALHLCVSKLLRLWLHYHASTHFIHCVRIGILISIFIIVFEFSFILSRISLSILIDSPILYFLSIGSVLVVGQLLGDF